MYELTIKKQANKALLRMPRQDATRILAQLDMLAENPDRQDMDIIALTNRSGYRLRVGRYRVIYERNDSIRVIAVEKIGHRKDVYEK